MSAALWDRITAPFTLSQVASLNAYQRSDRMHPFTCPDSSRLLVATEAGWVCRTCDYTQDWAHAFMGSWLTFRWGSYPLPATGETDA